MAHPETALYNGRGRFHCLLFLIGIVALLILLVFVIAVILLLLWLGNIKIIAISWIVLALMQIRG